MKPKWILIAASVGAAAALAAPTASAEPVVRQATGANAAGIQAAVDQFRADLGGGNTPGMNGSFGGVRREINWDGVPDAVALPDAVLPGGFFNADSPRGAALATPGVTFAVSADDDNPADPDADEPRFSNLRDSYATAFATFSAQRLFTPVGSTVTDTLFFVPGTDTQATTNGFGVVFTDVDAAGSAKLELIGPNGEDLGEFAAPPTPGDGSLTFMGVSFDAGERIARARTTSGTAAIQVEGNVEDVTQGGPADLVVMDDFIYGEPAAVAAGGNDTQGPAVELKGVRKKVDRDDLLDGLRVRVGTDEEARLEVALLATAASVNLGAARPNVILAERERGFGSGTRGVELKPSRKLIRGSRRFNAVVRVTATDRAGNETTVKRAIKVR